MKINCQQTSFIYMAEIKAIDKGTVHQICSGQVVLDLATAIKELVENSLDAGANCVEVKLKDWGLEQVEVIDNGSGVEKKNFAALTLKHQTSKLRDFSDLEAAGTFGFRGEALSSLCALCDVTISTKYANETIAYKLDYNHDGHIINETSTARQTGTTVTLRNIFSSLPVRHKEFKKNIKKEYTKALGVLSAYCIISTDAKISCSNQTGSGKKSVVLATQGFASLEKNIASIFGAKQLKTLKEFKQISPSAEVCEDYHIKESEALEISKLYTISGLVSDTVHGNGRSSSDRQFFFINSRPVDLVRLAKVINEVFHSYNRHQYPFVVLNIETKRESVDVNVTPNKRQVFLHHEKLLLAIVKTSMIELYKQDGKQEIGSVRQSLHSGNFTNNFQRSVKGAVEDGRCDATDDGDTDIFHQSSFSGKIDETHSQSTTINAQDETCVFSLLSKFKRKGDSVGHPPSSDRKRAASELPSKYPSGAKLPRTEAFTKTSNSDREFELASQNVAAGAKSPHSESEGAVKIEYIKSCDLDPNPEEKFSAPLIANRTSFYSTSSVEDAERDVEQYPASDREPTVVYDEDTNTKCLHKEPLSFSMQLLKKKLLNLGDDGQNSEVTSRFRAKINPCENTTAENELSRNLCKDAFLEMTPLGQFNLGFIIARHRKDLFIIDQHASDEIYNFETLQQTTEIHTQTLVLPQKLELTAADRLVLTDNMSIFQRNGFDFMIKKNEESDQETLYLTRVPLSKNWEFGCDDVEELIFMLSDAPGVMCRPSRVRKMFASRACRKSVMIGTPLNMKNMTKLIRHMSQINHPWNCPHGRPTMRHLIDLSMLFTADLT
ncbi:mismatch repair endonuclease PMS2-like [Clavelina lepadiformis]|uniref:mismatch repair endonuclease PMS2-like n=1 Tax=Clavelina lepadiformis TaxID=159417 RepID=UPI004041FA25